MHSGIRILIVDDKPAVLFTYKAILQQHGHDVTAAGTSMEAITALDSHVFDLILCDLTLEDNHNGFEVLDYARGKSPTVRSVLVTGYFDDEITETASQRGVSVLFKPIDIKELLSTIDTIGVGHRAIA